MPRLIDPEEIRRILLQDPLWSVYALGDLAPAAFVKSEWFSPGLTLIYKDYGTCILFSFGDGGLPEALKSVSWPVHLQVLPETLTAIESLAVVTARSAMWRMGWTGDRSGWTPTAATRRLGMSDLSALQALYADGNSTGESPDFFFPSMLAEGVFFGVFQGAALVSAAGTHLFAPEEGVAAIGNVYTRRDKRGCGLGRAATCATVAALSEVPVIGLNVRADNSSAIRLYESLGFRRHCLFFEALALSPR